jgi:hypothetical protein
MTYDHYATDAAADLCTAEGDADQADAQANHHCGSEPMPSRPAGNRCRAQKVDGSGPCPVQARADGYCFMHSPSKEARAIAQAGRVAGGKAPRALVGLDAAAIDGIDLKSSDGQIRVLEATARALAAGKVGGATASALASIVKTAAGILASDQQAALDQLSQRVDELLAGKTVDVRR